MNNTITIEVLDQREIEGHRYVMEERVVRLIVQYDPTIDEAHRVVESELAKYCERYDCVAQKGKVVIS